MPAYLYRGRKCRAAAAAAKALSRTSLCPSITSRLHAGGDFQVQIQSGGHSGISEEHSTISSVSSPSAQFHPTLYVSVLVIAITTQVTHCTAVLGVTPPYKKIKDFPYC